MAIPEKDKIKSASQDGSSFSRRTGKDQRDMAAAEKHAELEQSCDRMQNCVASCFGIRAKSQHFPDDS